MAPTTIRSISVERLDIALSEPFGIAGGIQHIAHNVLVTIELADGTCGFGEAAPLPAFNGETQAQVLDALSVIGPLLEGADVRHWRPIAATVRHAAPSVGSARCAVETAVLDAFTKHAHVPLWAFFGGSGARLQTDMTITTSTDRLPANAIEHARRSASQILDRGIEIIKVKVGGGAPELDVDRVAAIRAAAPHVPIYLDGNAGFSAAEALRLLRSLRAIGVVPALFEQPVHKDDLAGLRDVRSAGGVPVVADESAPDLAGALLVVEAKAADAINIKLMKCGIVEALDIVALCRATSTRMMIGGMVESILAMTMSAHFASGLGGFDYVDLDTPMFMIDKPFAGGFVENRGWIDVHHISEGHGVWPS